VEREFFPQWYEKHHDWDLGLESISRDGLSNYLYAIWSVGVLSLILNPT
jgi:hypothetical protein